MRTLFFFFSCNTELSKKFLSLLFRKLDSSFYLQQQLFTCRLWKLRSVGAEDQETKLLSCFTYIAAQQFYEQKYAKRNCTFPLGNKDWSWVIKLGIVSSRRSRDADRGPFSYRTLKRRRVFMEVKNNLLKSGINTRVQIKIKCACMQYLIVIL